MAQNENFPAKNVYLGIQESLSEWQNVSKSNNEGKLYSYIVPVDRHGREVEDAGGDGDDAEEVVDVAVDAAEDPLAITHVHVVEHAVEDCHLLPIYTTTVFFVTKIWKKLDRFHIFSKWDFLTKKTM